MNITINNLGKSYGKKEVLKDINLEIEEGMFGLLGPNGAGKTTLMRILTTLIPKNQGNIKINNIDISNKKEIRKTIGYLPQDFSIYPTMSVYEALDYLALLSGIKNKIVRKERIEYLLQKVNLENHKNTKVRALSGGMKRRLGIAQAILHHPKIIIVDEPTAGLDPEERIRFRNLLRDFSEGRIVILSTHIVEDVEFTCENLAILNNGGLLYTGKVKELLQDAEGYVWTVNINREELDSVRNEYQIISTVSEGDLIKLRLISKDKPFENANSVKPSIEDAYMKLMKEV
ncbi:ABC transporter ATP-binding protein [Clostridium sp. MB40-C1]|uniref:ABC transporter ATP-binding protein n=1 Tax=Clostridium sp. MB40-C1 TaxID=3070996 RepID=UPI0027E1A2B3|nr:ABC transporter ATP-binding protein [Clostridium sp. MB40-C1]WMJ79357.1 ABC transporter ATP-binding protein [Clostridium sp. MB40-C1]